MYESTTKRMQNEKTPISIAMTLPPIFRISTPENAYTGTMIQDCIWTATPFMVSETWIRSIKMNMKPKFAIMLIPLMRTVKMNIALSGFANV